MKQNNDIVEELKSMGSELAYMSRTMPYSVPGGYFQSLADNVAMAVAPEPRFVLGKKNPYDIPQDYFVTLPILLREKLNEVPELPRSISPYQVPANYFESLPQQVINKVREENSEGRSIPFSGMVWRYARLAVAAVLLMGIGIYLYKFEPSSSSPAVASSTMNIQAELATIPDTTLSSYLAQNIDDFDADMIVTNMQPGDIHQPDKQLKDRDIQQYLNEYGYESTE